MEQTETIKSKLTAEQLEHLRVYLEMYARAYYFLTRIKLTTVDEVIDLIMNDVITFEDVFDVYVDKCFKDNGDDDEEDFWERHMEKFMYENYYPNNNKNVNEGAWIKIRTENGFEVHYAKKSNRKRRYNEEYAELLKQYQRIGNTSINRMTRELAGVTELDPTATELSKRERVKMDTLSDKMKEIAVRILLALPVYEVKINRTKSSLEYYLPYQYEIVTDIDEFSDAYVAGLPGVTAKSLYTSQNSDAVFYLQSRGISKKVAEMMAALKQTYFKVDMITAMKAYDDMLKSRIKFVKSSK